MPHNRRMTRRRLGRLVQFLAIALALGNLAGGRWLGPDWAPEWILVIFGLFTAGLWLAEGGESKNRSEP